MVLLTKEQQMVERLRSMAITFGKADSIFFGGHLRVQVVANDAIQAPGYSTERDIFLNLPHIGAVDSTDDIIKVTGLNFHELAHCMYTPGPKTWLGKEVLSAGLNSYFNMLEDQRIETMLSAEFNAMKPYFTMTIMKYIANTDSEQALASAHALTYGRKYLPTNIRDLLRQRWAKPEVLTELERIIDQYTGLIFPRDDQVGLRLIREYANLLKQAFGQDHPKMDDPYGHSSGTRPQEGGMQGSMSEERQRQAQQDVKDGDAEPDDEGRGCDGDGQSSKSDDDGDADDDGAGSGDGDQDGDEADGDGSGSGSGDSDQDTDQDGHGGDGKSDRKSDREGPSSDGNGGGGAGRGGKAGKVGQLTDQDIRDEMNRVAQEQQDRPDVQRDARIKQDAIKSGTGQLPNLNTKDFTLRDVTPEYAMAAVGFKKQLMKLWADADPGWDRYKSSGRLNIGRVMRGDDPEQVFDQWNPGKSDATSIELVLLFDYSGSMRSSMWAGSQSLWAIKRAVESIGGDVTVVGYESESTTFYTKQDKAHPTMCRAFNSSGGTNPLEALDAAMSIMHYSKKVHKFVVILTDGHWSYPEPSQYRITQLNQHGIITALAGLGSATGSTHGCTVSATIDSPLGLVELAKSLVQEGIKVPVP